jgi:hypothetical protein
MKLCVEGRARLLYSIRAAAPHTRISCFSRLQRRPHMLRGIFCIPSLRKQRKEVEAGTDTWVNHGMGPATAMHFKVLPAYSL